ncbi:MAG: FG-GAP repeat domain-containing protein [Gammaproteobacteria bacterium]
MVRRSRAILVSLGACAGSAFAQSPLYTEVTATHLPAGIAGRCMDAAAGDADGDGDLDLALALEFEPNILLLNDGSGRFENASDRLPRDVHDSEDVEFADLDGDGDLDLFLVSEDDETNELYLNDGAGRYIDASDRIPVTGVSNGHAVLDIDNDGDIDLLIGNQGPNRLLLNDGEGNFTDRTADLWPNDSPTQDLELVDVDADGDLDVVVANEAQNRLFLNNGGRLVDATIDRMPAREDETREIRAADVDGDGDPDLLVANVSFVAPWSRQDRLLLNDGEGFFVDADPSALPADDRDHFSIQAADLDADGDLDVITPHSVVRGGAGDYRVLSNDGNGVFSEREAGSILPETADGNGFDIEVADFNDDGSDDLFFCNRSSVPNPGAGVASGGQPRLLLRD